MSRRKIGEQIREDRWADDADGDQPFEFGKEDGDIDLIPVCDEVNLAWRSRRAVAESPDLETDREDTAVSRTDTFGTWNFPTTRRLGWKVT